MGFGLHTLAHLAGDVASPLANGAGAVTGINSLTTLGHNIGSPTVTLSNPGGLLASNNPAFTGPGAYASGASQPTKNAGTTGSAPGASVASLSGPVTDGGSGAGGTGGVSASDLAAYGLYTGQTNDALSRALAAWNTQQGNINSSFNTQQNALNSSADAAKATYNNGITGNQQSKLTNDNSINNASNAGYQSILRILGGLGAGGGSEAKYLVPQLVGQEASTQLANSGQTFAQNAKAIDQNYGDFQNEEKNQQAQLNDWKTGQLATDAAAYNTTKSNLLNILSGLTNHSAAPSDLATSLNSVVSSIPNEVAQNPTYTGTTPVYTAPSLSSFESGTTPTATVAAPTPGGSLTPYLALLAGQQKKQQPVTA